MADQPHTPNEEPEFDTSWVTPMGKRARLLINSYNSEDPAEKADAVEKILTVGEQLEYFLQLGQPLTQAQQALMDIYLIIRKQEAA